MDHKPVTFAEDGFAVKRDGDGAVTIRAQERSPSTVLSVTLVTPVVLILIAAFAFITVMSVRRALASPPSALLLLLALMSVSAILFASWLYAMVLRRLLPKHIWVAPGGNRAFTGVRAPLVISDRSLGSERH